jgi:RNA polymerase-binding transcription factor DksA
MVRLYSIRNLDMTSGSRACEPESGKAPDTGRREIPHSPEISADGKTVIRRLLQTWRRSLLGQLHRMVLPFDTAGAWPGSDHGFADDAVAAEVAMIRILGINRELQQIEDALQRIGKDGFGNCVYCRGPIGPTRLESRPTARSCLRCQNRLLLQASSSGLH